MGRALGALSDALQASAMGALEKGCEVAEQGGRRLEFVAWGGEVVGIGLVSGGGHVGSRVGDVSGRGWRLLGGRWQGR